MKNPRGRMPNPKPNQLMVGWAAERHDEPTLQFCYGGGRVGPRDNNMLMSAFHTAKLPSGNTFVEELIERGYDLSTLRFSVEKLPGESDVPVKPLKA
jgi:hypothetical protein